MVRTRSPLPGRGCPAGAGEECGQKCCKQVQPFRLIKKTEMRWKSKHFTNCKVTARIPLQSKIGSPEPIFDSFPPGEAIGSYRFPTI